jgi:hypothetical protein
MAADDPPDSAAARKTLERLESMRQIALQREAVKVVQLPLWPDAKRGTPNSFIRSALFSAIQSKDRIFIKNVTLFSQQGITVRFTGEQLNQEDLTLWETLVHLGKAHPLGNCCTFTARSILRMLGLNTGGDEHRRLHTGIIRLTACAVEITHDDRTYFGPLIKAGAKDEASSYYNIELNREIIRLYGETAWTAIDWRQRAILRRKPLAQALHAYYSSHRAPHPVTVDFLQRMTGSRNVQRSSFRRQLKAALNVMVEMQFLESFAIEKDLVTAKRCPQAPSERLL